MAGPQRNYLDGGEAVLEALRRLGVDYILSSPGSEMSPIWEAIARQKTTNTPGPEFLDCWHEMVAVDMALGYTAYTGRMQAVMLHAGVGMLQGAMGVLSATASETPMVIMSGESVGFGEQPNFYMEPQWYGGVSVGGPDRLVHPVTKKAGTVVHADALYESVIRAGELAVREQRGPVYLGLAMETLLAEWRKPPVLRDIPAAPRVRALDQDVDAVAKLLAAATNPMVVVETAGRDPESFAALVALAEAWALPVYGARSQVTYASFPTNHPLWQGFFEPGQLAEADLILLVGGRLPWYPPSQRPCKGQIVSIGDNPIKRHLAYQVLLADHYLEGDMTVALTELAGAAKSAGVARKTLDARRSTWAKAHAAIVERLAAQAARARKEPGIGAVSLASVAAEVMPADTIWTDETITHMGVMRPYLPLDRAQSYFRVSGGGLGQGIAISLGLKLAAKDRPVVLFVGDGSLLYNPIIQALGAAKAFELPLIIVVCNNAKYAAMQRGHLNYYPGGAADTHKLHMGVHIEGPEYHELGSHFGMHGVKVDNLSALADAFRAALAANKEGRTSIINVVMTA